MRAKKLGVWCVVCVVGLWLVGWKAPTSRPVHKGASGPAGSKERAVDEKQSAKGKQQAQTGKASSRPVVRRKAAPRVKAVSSAKKQGGDSFLRRYARSFRFRMGRPRSFRFLPGGEGVFFLRSGGFSFVQSLYFYDRKARKERLFLTAKQLLRGVREKLSAAERARRERMRMAARGIASFRLSRDGKTLLIPLGGRMYLVERVGKSVREVPRRWGSVLTPRFSPDGRFVASVQDSDVVVFSRATGKSWRVTKRKNKKVENGLAEFVAQEEMGRMQGFWWSPDSRSLLFQRTRRGGMERLYLMDPSRPWRAPRSWPYPRAGKKNAQVRLGIVGREGGKPVWIKWSTRAYPYVATVRWKKGAPLTILVQNRTQTKMQLLAVEPRSGKTRVLLEESDRAWLNLDQSVPRWLRKGKGFLWSSEREGQWVLELRARDGKLVRVLTTPQVGYRRLLGVDEARGVVFVSGSKEPTERHLWRISLGTGKAVRLTKAVGIHRGSFSDKAKWYVHARSIAGTKPDYVLRSADGARVGRIRSQVAWPNFVPRTEVVKVGKRKLRAVLVRPRNFVKGRRYPVVLHVYGGPGGTMVWSSPWPYLRDQWIADHGVVVVLIDGRGTPGRGRRWERAIKGDFVTLPLADQVAGLKALAKRYKELDLTRVGIYGWSFGGTMTAMALLRYPEVFRVGVAGAPVADWRDYDTHYTERYLGLPQQNPKAYKVSSVLTYAHRLKRPLLLVHGTADDNVYLTHSLKLSRTMFAAGRKHELLLLSGSTHMVARPTVVQRLWERMLSHLLSHLQR